VSRGNKIVAINKIGSEQEYEKSEQKCRMCLLNLATSIETLSDFQKEFRTHFGRRILTAELNDLDRREKRALSRLWAISHEFIRDPSRTHSNLTEYAESIQRNNHDRFLCLLRNALADLQREGTEARLVSVNSNWSGRKALWITASVQEARGLERIILSVASAISAAVAACRFDDQEALPLVSEWKYIVVVPQFRKRSLAKVASSIPSTYFLIASNQSELPLIYTFSVPVEKQDWAHLNLTLWTAPVASLTMKWYEASHLLVIQLQMCFNLFTAATQNSVFPEVLRQHEERFTRNLSEAVNSAYTAYEHLRDFLAMRLDSSLSAVTQGIGILERLKEWAKAVFPQEQGVSGTIVLDIERFSEWMKSLGKAAPETPVILAGILECFLPTS
ncbi:MAG: hypothetical protein NTV82_03245, partial [Candidatus Aminicenantes bacterium]|nr:hypothetical protein [Candidatus Aminicenantes bacterium]